MLASPDLESPPCHEPDPRTTLDAIRRLDLHRVDCDGPVARGILTRAIAYLEASLRTQLTGPA
jgi:hypothetical protein